MLIDDFLPNYDIREQHRVIVRSPLDVVYAAVRQLDISQARLSMLLFRLRGISAGVSAPGKFTLEDFLKMRFILLGETANEELLLGLAGQFWTPKGKLRRLDREGFLNFNDPGYAKAVWSFSLMAQDEDSVLLETETRVQCLDEVSRRRFRLYWLAIGSFSGLIRREILWSVKRQAELAYSRMV